MPEAAADSTPAGPLQSVSGSRGARVSFLPPVHSIIFAMLAIVMQHIQNKCQFTKISPYEEQSGITSGIYISLFLYAMALFAEFGCKISNHALLLLIKRFSPMLGTFLVTMHIFLLSPEFGWFLLTLWAMFLVGALLRSLAEILQIYECLSDLISGISEKMNDHFHNISEKIRIYFHGHGEDGLPQ